ncbi:hypothetical protein ACFX1X_012991 [Malus domestica]
MLTALPPSSSKPVVCPAKPGYGKVGEKVQVRANHCLVEVRARDLYHYDNSPVESVVSSTKTKGSSSNNDEEDFLAKLTRHLAQSSLQPTHRPEAIGVNELVLVVVESEEL